MTEYDSPKRNLTYPLRNALVFSQTTEDDGGCLDELPPFAWPEDSDERVDLIFNLSLNEYNVLANAIDVGSDIAYGEDALRVVWLWLRNMRCPVSICDLVRDAIANCSIVREEIIDLVVGNLEVRDDIYSHMPPEFKTGNLYPDVPVVGQAACGAADYIVNQIRDLIVDVYSDLATIEPDDVVQALLNQNGWNAVSLIQLVTQQEASLENEVEMLAAFDADKDDMICELKNHSLDRSYITSWVETAFATYPAVRPIIQAAIDAANDDGRWAMWATIGADNDVECPDDCDTPTLELEVVPGYDPTKLDFIETTSEGDVYEAEVYDTGNYAMLAIRSVGAVAFYIVANEPVGSATFGRNLWVQSGIYTPENMPCWKFTTFLTFYLDTTGGEQMAAGDKLRFTVAPLPCHEIYLKPRTDGDWAGTTSIVSFVGYTTEGYVIYDITSSLDSGPNKYGIDTVEEDLTTLKEAYLVSATVGGVEVYAFYHEQEYRDGLGDGASGTIASKRWSWINTGDYHQTIRLVFSDRPY